ncbi:MAG: hypothetical protein ACE5DX_04130 [Candidatus Dojkabacteria bacterium]
MKLYMIISIEEVLKKEFITNRDYANGLGLVEPEGAAIDVRVGEIWKMIPSTRAFLKKDTRQTRQYIKMETFTPDEDRVFVLKPKSFYQFRTVELLAVPKNLMVRFNPRYNLGVNGIQVFQAKADPGYSGTFGVPVVNLSGVPFEIELGARFGQFEFHTIKGKTYSYRGQWQGGRLFTDEEEVQV